MIWGICTGIIDGRRCFKNILSLYLHALKGLVRVMPIDMPLNPLAEKQKYVYGDEISVHADELWFRYEKDLPDVVKGFSLTLRKGEFTPSSAVTARERRLH